MQDAIKHILWLCTFSPARITNEKENTPINVKTVTSKSNGCGELTNGVCGEIEAELEGQNK